MPDGERTIDGSHILSHGSHAHTAGIGLDVAGVELDARGYSPSTIARDERPRVWAIGECAGSPQFTHVSFDDFRVLRDNLAGGHRTTRDRLVPFCVFTIPARASRPR